MVIFSGNQTVLTTLQCILSYKRGDSFHDLHFMLKCYQAARVRQRWCPLALDKWFYYHLRSTVKPVCFFVHVYFSNETVSQTTVSTGPMKIFRLGHETMNVCQRNVACFAQVECGSDKIKTSFRVLEAWCHCDFRKMEVLNVNKLDKAIALEHRWPKLSL